MVNLPDNFLNPSCSLKRQNLTFKSAHFRKSIACEQQTHFRSSLLSLLFFRGREATTGNASAVRRLENPRQSCILVSTPWIPDSRYCIPDFVGGTWILDPIPIVSGIPDSLRCISHSKARDSRFYKQNVTAFQVLHVINNGEVVGLLAGKFSSVCLFAAKTVTLTDSICLAV